MYKTPFRFILISLNNRLNNEGFDKNNKQFVENFYENFN